MSEEKKIQEIFDALKSETLTERERFVMRSELQDLMRAHPMHVPAHIRMWDRLHAFDNAAMQYAGSHGIATAALVLVLVAGVGTSYAAQGALPGDILYPMKINVNEKVQGALAVSDVAKVDLSAQLASRRLGEAEVLAAQGRLTPQDGAEIAASIDNSTQNFDKYAADLAKTPENDETVADAQTNLQATLTAHAQVLSSLSAQLPQVQNAITPILSTVSKKAHNAQAANLAAQLTLTKKNADSIKTAVKVRKQRAVDQLNQVRTLANQNKDTLGSSTFTYIHEEASSTQQTINAADSDADNGDYDKAIQSYQNAIQVSAQAKAGLDAQIHIRQSLHDSGTSNINFTIGDGSGDDGNKDGDNAATSTDRSD